jgi:ethanolamine utilization protein EutP (predicted NTPase)
MFNRTVLGLVTGVAAEGADVARAGRLLGYAGAREILRIDMDTGWGVEALRKRLASAEK